MVNKEFKKDIDSVLENSYEDVNNNSNFFKTFRQCIDMEKFIECTRNIIDKSESFNFRSNRAKKFIDVRQPMFILSVKDDIIAEANKNNPSELSKLTDKITSMLYKEVVSEISKIITDCIKDRNKLNELFKDLPTEIDDTVFTNIYIVRLNLENNSVVLKYFV